MQIVNLRAHPRTLGGHGRGGSAREVEESLPLHMFDSAPKNIGRQLLRRGLVSRFVEWRFWGFPTKELHFQGLPLLMHQTEGPQDIASLERHVASVGQPDVIWAEGIHFPDLLRQVFAVCPESLKVIYPKYCQPWIIEGLDQYDACLVDEEWQIDEMARRCPGTRCYVWDKLIDYEGQFFPLSLSKRYDVCYTARLHPRKNHEVLFTALGKLRERRLSAVLIGTNENDCQKYLEPMAAAAGVEATFTGHVEPEEVNRLINQSRIGVICDQFDAVPRAMLEYMAADVPLLVNAEMQAGIRYVGPRAGMLISPSRFHEGITELLDRLDVFRPREHLLENYSNDKATDRFWGIVQDLLSRRRPDSAAPLAVRA
jgi:glycosyltransferase involved in cell wall biosynthesis